MRFGQDLHRWFIPEWSEHYVDYNRLKGSIKSSALLGGTLKCPLPLSWMGANGAAEVYKHLDTSISALDAFLRLRFKYVSAVEAELCEAFGLDMEPAAIPDAVEICPFELTLLLDAFSEFQQDLKKLQWFEKLNADAIGRILAKLERYGQADSPTYRNIQSRWQALQPAWETKLFDRLSRLARLITDISGGLALPERAKGRSLYLAHALRQSPWPQASANALQQSFLAGDADPVIQLLISTQTKQNVLKQSSPHLVRDLLKFSAVRVPAQYEALLVLLPSSERLTTEQDAFKWWTAAIGRRQKLNFSSRTTEVYRKYALSNTEVRDRWASQAPQTKDRFGRLLLHHASSYGLLEVCQELIQKLPDSPTDANAAVQAILSADNEGLTPLHLAVVGNHALAARYLIDCINTRNDISEVSLARAIMGDLLTIALMNQNDEIVRCLLHGRADLCRRSSRGEIALHVAAQVGRVDYTTLVLQAMSKEGVELDVPNTSRGWTPLFFACANGHYDIVQLLLKAGLSQERTDCLGWTAKEYAVFKGHLVVADLFETPDVCHWMGGPASRLAHKSAHSSVRCRDGERIITASLGTARINRVVAGLDLPYCSSVHNPGEYEGMSFALEVSVLGTSKSRRVSLPILNDQINDPFVFLVPGIVKPCLVFNIFRLTGVPGRELLVASGTALLESNSHQFGAGRQSLIREQTVPILDKDTMGMVGTVTFTFLVAKSFPHLQTSRPVDLVANVPRSPLLVGHRGAGQNVKTHEHLQIGENTLESFLSAAKLGASFVEFDIQITRDLKAVAFHDFSLSESGTDVPIHDITLDQFLHASNLQSPHGNPLSVLGKVHSGDEAGRPRSRSLDRRFEAGAVQIRDRMKHTVDFKQKGFKPNTRGDFVRDSFATLREILVELPQDIGCDIEIKYPRLHEAVDAGVAPVAIEINTFVDIVLEELHRYGGERHIILSSFTPEICILLAVKQKVYPVFFITNAGKMPMSDMEVRAASLQVAVQFARRWNLAGVVFACLNNEPEMVKLQAQAGVDIIVADRVGTVARTLAAISAAPN
ncbi:hypothetical protein DL766_006109 [Monosporascus sp. MC13-8B]|nr:hypothetical protein DL763_010325 [Monosporascus cannonballus]RYP27980.1 hypothetical protein DL766_006109 [Monosporascus sp. MC13-8B]